MELALPITIYWDLTADMPLDSSLLRCCDEILACRPLMLQLYDPSQLLSEAALAILERFKGSQVAVTLTIPYSSLLNLKGTTAGELGVKELLVAFDALGAIGDVPRIPETGLSFTVTRGNWHELPDVVSLCRKSGGHRLVLPMQRLYSGEAPFLLSKSDQQILEEELVAIGGTAGLRLTIHDPFLWRAFNPGVPFPQAGCQAANTMIAISPDGGVYPCPTLPEKLGSIGSTSLRDIITSPAKKELRKRITESPAACVSCLEVSICRGGCRGRSLVTYGSFEEIDDACQ